MYPLRRQEGGWRTSGTAWGFHIPSSGRAPCPGATPAPAVNSIRCAGAVERAILLARTGCAGLGSDCYVALRPRTGTRVADDARGDEPIPDKQNDKRTDGRADETRALVGMVPSDRLPDEGGQKRPGDAEHNRQDESTRVVRPRRQQARNDAGNEPDDENPEHVRLLTTGPRSAEG